MASEQVVKDTKGAGDVLEERPAEMFPGFVPTVNGLGFMFTELDPISKACVADACSHEDTYVDIGCAYGVATLPVLQSRLDKLKEKADKTGEPQHIVAIDNGKGHLDVLSKDSKPIFEAAGDVASLVNLETVHQCFPITDAERLDGKVQTVLAARVLHFMAPEEFRKAMTMIHTWLKPGGKFFVIAETPFLGPLADNFFPVYESRIAGTVGPDDFPGLAQRPEGAEGDAGSAASVLPAMMNLMDMATLTRELERVGFEIQSIDYMDRRGDYPPFLHKDGRESIGAVAIKK